MPIGATAWYRTIKQVDPAGPVGQLTFDAHEIHWPFATAGLSVLRTRVTGNFYWNEASPTPRPGPALGLIPVGVQVQFWEPTGGVQPALVPTLNEANMDNRYKATINEAVNITQVEPTSWDSVTLLPNGWTTYAEVNTESADSAAQRHFDSGQNITMWITVGPVNHWVVDLTDSPLFACALAISALIGSHT